MVFMTKGAGRTVYKGKLCTVKFKPKTLFSFCLYRDNKKVPTQTFTHSNPPPPCKSPCSEIYQNWGFPEEKQSSKWNSKSVLSMILQIWPKPVDLRFCWNLKFTTKTENIVSGVKKSSYLSLCEVSVAYWAASCASVCCIGDEEGK